MPTEHELWPAFVEYARLNGVSLDSEDDWGPWWECFLAGATVVRDHYAGSNNDE